MADEREFPEFQVRHPSNTNPICLTKLVTRYINPGYQNTHRTHSEIAEIGTNTKLTNGTKNKNDYTSLADFKNKSKIFIMSNKFNLAFS